MSDKSFPIRGADWTGLRWISIAIAHNLVGPAASSTIMRPFVPSRIVYYPPCILLLPFARSRNGLLSQAPSPIAVI